MIKIPIAAVATLALLPLCSGASAKEANSSVYERFVFKKCPIIEQGERHSTHRCKMKKGPDLVFDYHEHGIITYLEPAYSEKRYGEDGFFQRADSGHFGELFTNKKGQTTVEWRVRQVKGKWRPFAAIFRTNYGATGNSGQRLDVISFDESYACLAGYVEASEKNHNVRARELADNALKTSVCAAKAREWTLSEIEIADRAIEDAQKNGAARSIGSIEAAIRAYETAEKYYAKTGEGAKGSEIQQSLSAARQLLADAKN